MRRTTEPFPSSTHAWSLLRRHRLPNTPKVIAKWFGAQQLTKSWGHSIYLEVMRRAHDQQLWRDTTEAVPLVHTETVLFRVPANQLASDFAGSAINALASATDE